MFYAFLQCFIRKVEKWDVTKRIQTKAIITLNVMMENLGCVLSAKAKQDVTQCLVHCPTMAELMVVDQETILLTVSFP